MTSKLQALLYGALSGLSGFVQTLALVPPEQQSGLLAQLVEVFPVSWRPQIAVWTGLLKWGLLVYALRQASHSGPQTPPVNKPTE